MCFNAKRINRNRNNLVHSKSNNATHIAYRSLEELEEIKPKMNDEDFFDNIIKQDKNSCFTYLMVQSRQLLQLLN